MAGKSSLTTENTSIIIHSELLSIDSEITKMKGEGRAMFCSRIKYLGFIWHLCVHFF